MRKQTVLTVLAATMLVLAGCSGGTPADGGASPEDGTADGEDGTSGTTDDGGSATGTVEFYVSDMPGRIDDFRHLNVTIDRIGFQRAEGETDTTNETATPTNATNTTATATNDSEMDDDNETDGDSNTIVRDVDARSVDLTRLRGDNATLIGTPEIPAGNYTMVTVHVSEINATLTDGSSVNVKLPSNTLKLNKGFDLEPNGTVSFVYDISVFKAGNSGKYILKPVIGESGPDQNVKMVDDNDTDADDAEAEDSDADEGDTDDSDDSDTDEETATATATATPTAQAGSNQGNGAGN
jgi:hypothetical protein